MRESSEKNSQNIFAENDHQKSNIFLWIPHVMEFSIKHITG